MIPLEDNVGDIIGKAQRGLGISDSELAKKAGVDLQTIRKLRDGDFDEAALSARRTGSWPGRARPLRDGEGRMASGK